MYILKRRTKFVTATQIRTTKISAKFISKSTLIAPKQDNSNYIVLYVEGKAIFTETTAATGPNPYDRPKLVPRI